MTAPKPDIVLLPNQDLVLDEHDQWRVVTRVERLTNTISFRLTASEYAAVIPFINTFASGSDAMRHLLFENLKVREVLRERVAAATRIVGEADPSPPPSA